MSHVCLVPRTVALVKRVSLLPTFALLAPGWAAQNFDIVAIEYGTS